MKGIDIQEKNEIIINALDGQAVTSSLDVARVFEKRHDNVLRAIRDLILKLAEMGSPQNLATPPRFIESTWTNEQNGETYPEYLMNRDGFVLLVMGFTGQPALRWKVKYIEAFNAMEKKLLSSPAPTLQDNRLEIAKLIVKVPRYKLPTIKELYPEYFTDSPEIGSLEYASDINTAYMKWKDDFDISIDWISSFPTTEIYNHYVRYCVENKSPNMGKKTFYRYLEYDFNLKPKQKGDGYRYFLTM